MKKFEAPEIQVERLDVADVITTSDDVCTRHTVCQYED